MELSTLWEIGPGVVPTASSHSAVAKTKLVNIPELLNLLFNGIDLKRLLLDSPVILLTNEAVSPQTRNTHHSLGIKLLIHSVPP